MNVGDTVRVKNESSLFFGWIGDIIRCFPGFCVVAFPSPGNKPGDPDTTEDHTFWFNELEPASWEIEVSV